MIYFYQLFLLCLPISSLTWLPFSLPYLGKGKCVSSLHLSKPVQPSPLLLGSSWALFTPLLVMAKNSGMQCQLIVLGGGVSGGGGYNSLMIMQ